MERIFGVNYGNEKKNPHSYPKLSIMALFGTFKIQLKFQTIERFKLRQYLLLCAIWYTSATKKREWLLSDHYYSYDTYVLDTRMLAWML